MANRKGVENSPLYAIRQKCIECSGDGFLHVKFCQVTDCALWPFRFGKRPHTAKKSLGPLLDPEKMPPHNIPLEECNKWFEENHG
jgi:hypothetical protein